MISDPIQFAHQSIVMGGHNIYGAFRVTLDHRGGVITWHDAENGFHRTLTLNGASANWEWEFPYRRLWHSNLMSILWSMNWWVSWSDPNIQQLSVRFSDTLCLDAAPVWFESGKWIDLGRPEFVAASRSKALTAAVWIEWHSKNNWGAMFDQGTFKRLLDFVPSRFAKRTVVESTLRGLSE